MGQLRLAVPGQQGSWGQLLMKIGASQDLAVLASHMQVPRFDVVGVLQAGRAQQYGEGLQRIAMEIRYSGALSSTTRAC